MGKRNTEVFYVLPNKIVTEKEFLTMYENKIKDLPNMPMSSRRCNFCGGFYAGWHYCEGRDLIKRDDLFLLEPNKYDKELVEKWVKSMTTEKEKEEVKSLTKSELNEIRETDPARYVEIVHPESDSPKTAKSVMVGGTHYKGGIQPIEFYQANPQLDFFECNMIKYAYRHKNKNGLQDLLKVVHYAMIEADLHYKADSEFKDMIKGLM